MSNNPRLATLEQVMNGNAFELVDSPWGVMPAWKVQGMAMGAAGALEALHNVYQVVRSDAATQEARANADKAQHALLRRLFTTVGKFLDATDHMVSRVEAAEEQHRADEEQQREFEEAPLSLPPDLDRPQDLPPSKIEDETHQPSGELHAIAAKEDLDLEDTPPPPEPLDEPFAGDGDDMGGVPLSYPALPTSYVRGGPKDTTASKDQREFPDPELPKPPVISQPVAISLNEQDR